MRAKKFLDIYNGVTARIAFPFGAHWWYVLNQVERGAARFSRAFYTRY